MTKESDKKSKKAKRKVRSTKKGFQKIIALLDASEPKLEDSVQPYMDIYWADESEVIKEEKPRRSGT